SSLSSSPPPPSGSLLQAPLLLSHHPANAMSITNPSDEYSGSTFNHTSSSPYGVLNPEFQQNSDANGNHNLQNNDIDGNHTIIDINSSFTNTSAHLKDTRTTATTPTTTTTTTITTTTIGQPPSTHLHNTIPVQHTTTV